MKSADSLSLNRFVHTFGDSLREKYGENVYKISLSGNFTCPNRDGTLGRGGCTFCSVASFAGSPARKSLREQLLENRNPRARLFLAYFQAYTSTYAEFAVLKKCYDEALASPEVIGLCVGTRPDCVSDEILGLLEDYGKQGFEVWLELGLQSSFDETLERINRRHTFADYVRTAVRARERGIRVCAHIIVGLPGEGLMHSLTTLGRVLDTGADALKLHQLHIVRGSQMEREYRRGEIAALSLEEYARIAALMIQHTPENVLYERVGASALSGMLVAPDWAAKRWPVINAITAILAREGGQGSRVRCA
ncbi:TIGR01212 family radical SAM protein [Succinimonas sp.]|uniref:TIGR01212 family radical SAM protein n=1 Tax=Succinimonas sp. TaxID=1936151 RepID=UPI00386F61DC